MLSAQVPPKLKTLVGAVVVGRLMMVLFVAISFESLAGTALLALVALQALLSRKRSWALVLRWWLYLSGGAGVFTALLHPMPNDWEFVLLAWSALCLYTARYMASDEVQALFRPAGRPVKSTAEG